MKILKNTVSGFPVHPGLTLRDELAERGITQTAFARKIRRPVQMVNEIIRGRKSITAETAIAFEKALGISAELWLKMEASHQLSKARAAAARCRAGATGLPCNREFFQGSMREMLAENGGSQLAWRYNNLSWPRQLTTRLKCR